MVEFDRKMANRSTLNNLSNLVTGNKKDTGDLKPGETLFDALERISQEPIYYSGRTVAGVKQKYARNSKKNEVIKINENDRLSEIEAKLMKSFRERNLPVPKLYSKEGKTLEMEEIKGSLLKDKIGEIFNFFNVYLATENMADGDLERFNNLITSEANIVCKYSEEDQKQVLDLYIDEGDIKYHYNLKGDKNGWANLTYNSISITENNQKTDYNNAIRFGSSKLFKHSLRVDKYLSKIYNIKNPSL